MSRLLETTLKGMNYRLTPDTIREVAELCPVHVELRREPDNIHDENAIAVFCLEKPWRNAQFGYVERAVASELAPRMDQGKVEIVEAWLMEADETGKGPLQIKFKRAK